MVEYSLSLDSIFGSLADPTRRDILRRVAKKELSVSEISKSYDLTFAAISKHLKVLEKAKLVIKRKQGKEHLVRMAPKAITEAADYLEEYKQLWEDRLDALERYLESLPPELK